MRINREMNVATRLHNSAEMRRAARFADDGQIDRACRVVEDYLSTLNDPELEIFAERETVGWMGQLGHLDAASDLATALAVRAKRLWGDDERTLVIRNTELFWAGKAGFSRKAEKLADALVKDAAHILAPADQLTCAIRNNAARIYEDGANSEKAGEIYRKLLSDYAKWGESASEEACVTRQNYANYLCDNQEYRDSLRTLQYQLLLITSRWGEQSSQAFETRHEIALVMLMSGDTAAAVEHWEAVHRDASNHLGWGDPLALEAAHYLLARAVVDDDSEAVTKWSDLLIRAVSDLDEPELRATLEWVKDSYAQGLT